MSGDGGRVRAARPRELDRLAALFVALLEHHAERAPRLGPGAAAEDEARAHLAARLRDPDGALLVHEDAAGRADGLCVVRVLHRPSLFAETERGEVESLVVRPEARGGGAGRALGEAALAWLRERGLARVEVQVAVENPGARSFWEALGFGPAMDVLSRRL